MKIQRVFKLIVMACFAGILFSGNVLAQTDIKVACVGNSITEGSGTVPYPLQLDALLGTGWDVRNFGVSARTMLRQGDYPYWNETKFTDALNFQPDKVIISLGTNDSKYYNWVYGDEFYTDFLSMVDTFASLESHPDIWICHPFKAFSDIYDINDSVIFYGIIPLVDSIAKSRDVSVIDFYGLFSDKEDYYYDGIHPTTHGNNFIAKTVFEILVDSAIVKVIDNNVALNGPIPYESGSESNGTVQFINDGDMGTDWKSAELPATAVIDLGDVKEVDNFQLCLPADANKGYQYTIEGSLNGNDWVMLADQSDREDTIKFYSVDTVSPTAVQYIRLTITAFSNSTSEQVNIPEFRVLEYTGYKHAPLIYARLTTATSGYAYFTSLMGNQPLAYYSAADTSSYLPLLGFNANGSNGNKKITGATSDKFLYISESFYSGIQVNSENTYFTIPSLLSPINTTKGEGIGFSAFPNPANHEIQFNNLPQEGDFSIKIYDTQGHLVNQLLSSGYGATAIIWNATAQNGRKLPSGIYYCVLTTTHQLQQQQKIILK